MHAKTAGADGRWARVGSTNLNISSWVGNCELDAVIEDECFASHMEEMYLQDQRERNNPDSKRKLRAPGEPRHPGAVATSGGGSIGRAAAGALRIGNAVGAAFTSRRVLEPVQARIFFNRVQAALTAMPEKVRATFEFAFSQRLAHNEISKRLGEALGTVKSRIRQGLNIRNRLDR